MKRVLILSAIILLTASLVAAQAPSTGSQTKAGGFTLAREPSAGEYGT